MENDHTIHSFKFDLTQLSRQKHTQIEDRVVRIFNQSISSIVQRVAKRFAADQEIVLDQLVLDLEMIPQEELEQEMPLRFEKALQDYFIHRERTVLEQPKKEEVELKQHPLVFYLFYGIYPWYAPKKEPFTTAWSNSIKKKIFAEQLFHYNWPKRAIQRLVQLGFSQLLEQTIKALVPEESAFILNYHQELLEQQEKGELAKSESQRSFHMVIWEFTLQFILHAKGSRFSKKQFVLTQLHDLANYYNFQVEEFIQLIFRGFRELKTQNQHHKELYSIMRELNLEQQKREEFRSEKELNTDELKIAESWNIYEVEKILLSQEKSQLNLQPLRRWLAKQSNVELMKQHWLNPLKENLLYASVEVMLGKEGKALVQVYHELLWEEQDTSYEKTSRSAYKAAVWRFTLDFFHQSFSSYFQAKTFVQYHSRRLAQHLNLNIQLFLRSLIFAMKELAVPRSQLSLLSHILLHLYEEEIEEEEEIELLEKRFIKRSLNQLVYEFETKVFHSEKELYLFLENWAIHLLEATDSKKDLPISFLLSLLQKETSISESFLKVVKHHQQYEQQHTKSALPDFQYLGEVAFSRIENFNQELMLQQFVSGKKPLSFQLLQMLLQHEKQLSFTVVEKLQAALQKEPIKSLFLQEWSFRLNINQYASLFRLLFGANEYLFSSFQLIHYTFKKQAKNVKALFLKSVLENGHHLEVRQFWKLQLTFFSKELSLSQADLEQRIVRSIFERSVHHIQYLAHYIYLTGNKRFYGTANDRQGSNELRNYNITTFLKLAESNKLSFSAAQQKSWNHYLMQQLLTQPEEWMIEYMMNTSFRTVWESSKKNWSSSVQQLFAARQSQWEGLKKQLSISVMRSGVAHRYIHFVLQFETSDLKSAVPFNHWKEEEVQWLKQYLQKGKKLEQWVQLKPSIKINFLKRSQSIGNGFLMRYYQQLEAIYRQIPANNRPYSFFEFELSFWKMLSIAWRQQWSVWQIFEKWMSWMTRSLRVDASLYGDLQRLIPAKHEKAWALLKEKLKTEEESGQTIKEKQQVEEKFTDEISEPPIDKWELCHVGLVLLHPFLKQLFTVLNLLNEKQQFKSRIERNKAVYILHYLATGEKYGIDSREEHELAFPKLMCGMPISEVVDGNLTLTTSDIALADGMLAACLQHWDKLKSSSADTLRNTFLKRKGHIEEIDSAYQLFVEKSGTDVLLDYLPWSISLIRLTWLEQVLYVSWR